MSREWIPHVCILCRGPADGRDLCTPCHRNLPVLGPGCVRCARPLETGTGICGACLRRPPPQLTTVAALAYRFPVDQLVLALKFGHSLPAGRVLGELLADAVLACVPRPAPITTLVPVPLHPSRLHERGFNQAVEIARPVARRLHLPLYTDGCRRVRATPAQSGLSDRERRRNLKGAFVADARVAGMSIAIIDDVYTTGSTMAAVARALLAAGAREVEAWCVTRA